MKGLMIFTLMLLLAACSKGTTVPLLPDPVPNQSLNLTEKGLSIVLEENFFNESPSVIRTTIRNDSQQDYEFGEFYSIEMKKSGKWYGVKYSDVVFFQNTQFKDFGHELTVNSEIQQEFSLDELGLMLVPGEYRLVKTFLSTGTEIAIAASFTVK